MNKYVLNVDAGTFNSAGVKAKTDITKILVNNGYEKIDYFVPKSKIMRLLTAKIMWHKKLATVKNGIFVFQYPMYSRFVTEELIKIISKRKNVKSVAVIHDIEALRYLKDDAHSSQKELDILSQFDVLIVHNRAMKNWLNDKGVTANLVELEIFDYLNDFPMIELRNQENIIFAGNLEKSKFLTKLHINTPLILKGPNPDKDYPNNISYEGQHLPDELPKFLNGKFGLIWDGDSTDTCDGIFGEYLKFNNPHKTSLYLSMGIPVIIWNQAALAPFVEENNVGIIISSLDDIDRAVNKMSDIDYRAMKSNAERVGKQMRGGEYIIKALQKSFVM
ncbi:hypothetical protein [Leuconostoc mesenteroides]|uniref:hypothetical protein n=1 Tax=Leuconostoc mesenteroides TaxID=1245 RepID=UPI001C1FBD1A|nr:hypothetical protein [Leuconostoc mesenteroides]MBU7546176.1 hypothetical protein [Leuconostoc mesenteroides]